jgi:two-component system OmpR family sensor kinase
MTLARRISILVGAVIAVTSFSIALLAAFSGRSTAFDQVDERLLSLRSTSLGSDDPVSALLEQVGAGASDLVAYLLVDDEEPLTLLETSDGGVRRELTRLTEPELTELSRTPGTSAETPPTRLTAIDLGDGQWLVIGQPVDDIVRQFERQLLRNSMLAVVLALLGALVAAAMTRRTLGPLRRVVAYSGAVANGKLNAILDPDSSSGEIRELQTSITEMVESLKEAADVKAQSEADMRTFLADVAHELRTPLTTVRAYADVLAAEGRSDSEVRVRAQERIAQESRRMSRLIDDLLLLAQLASTRLGTTALVDVGLLMSTHFTDLRVLDPERSVEISCDSCLVNGDQALLERMFTNLASNIHRHTPTAASVAVSCIEGDSVQCIIDDAGPGLDDSQLQQLAMGMERFGQLRSGDRHGTGLGLYLVASIARSHGGVASFSRSPLGGLRVSVALPAARRSR